jgi:type IV pilus assembly protein PilQ
MMIKKMRYFVLLILFFQSLICLGQDRFSTIENKLRDLAQTNPGLNGKVELSVSGANIQDFIRGLASTHGLNVSVDAPLNQKVFNNFSNVTVAEVLLFLCRKYDLEISFIGSILSFSQFVPPVAPPLKFIPKALKINFDKTNNLISFDLQSDSLVYVAKEFTALTGRNIVFAPELAGKSLTAFVKDLPLSDALEMLAFGNGLKVTSTELAFFLEKGESSKPGLVKKGNTNSSQGMDLKSANGLISLDAKNIPISEIINAVSLELGNNYFLFSEPKGNSTLVVEDVTYEEFLSYLLNGSDYTFRKDRSIYLIGDRNLEGLRATTVIQLQNRTIDKVLDMIPGDLRKGVELKTFPDLNSIIVSGSQPRINEIQVFLQSLDKVVPNIVIDVIIADVRDSKTVSTGIKAGLGTAPSQTGGTVFPSVDLTLSSGTINEIISGINGFGIVNLGNVTPNFYISLKAMETQGFLKLRSTPKLSTLNGHMANMSIGKTEYYLETSNNVIGTQNPQNIITQQYKSVNADLSITINPTVSGDDQITLEITVKQSSFTERINPSAPPGTITREFKSLIRIKNGQTIILGGLEENSTSDSGSGVPFLSRIPVIKWLFSSRTKTKSNNKLTVFIKPTVVY